MEALRPVFHSSSLTPAISSPGIALAAPASTRAAGRSTAWAHGALVLSPEDTGAFPAAAWLRVITVTVVSHEGRGVEVANLCGNLPVFQSHAEPVEPGAGAMRIPFSVDLEALLGGPFVPGRFHVSVSARHHRSSICELVVGGASGEPGPFSPAHPARTLVDRLLQGYALAAVDLHARAADELSSALEDAKLREDLDGAHLYNAACVAARAVLADGGRGAEPRLARAIAWLSDDLSRRRELLAKRTIEAFDAAVERTSPSGEDDGVEALRQDTLRHFALARREDRDLETLRSVSGFAELFRRAR